MTGIANSVGIATKMALLASGMANSANPPALRSHVVAVSHRQSQRNAVYPGR